MLNERDVDLDDLPPVAQEIAGAIGIGPTLALVELRGGTRVYVPDHIADDHWLCKALGRDAADALSFAMPGEISVPRCAAPVRAALYRRIVADYSGGASAATLALEHGLTERRIYQIVEKRRAELKSRQTELFSHT